MIVLCVSADPVRQTEFKIFNEGSLIYEEKCWARDVEQVAQKIYLKYVIDNVVVTGATIFSRKIENTLKDIFGTTKVRRA